MYEEIAIGLGVVSILFQLKAASAETEANKIFYSFIALFLLIVLSAALVQISQATYTANISTVVFLAYWLMIITMILEVAMTLITVLFKNMLPKKWRSIAIWG